jgi:Ser/Thr protein kinase RdoA (MazF antagonist)
MRLVTWMDGATWSPVAAGADQAEALGALVARVDRQLAKLDLTAAEIAVLERPFRWHMLQALELRRSLDAVADPAVRAACARAFVEFETEVLPALAQLPHQVIHNDANENNIIVGPGGLGLIDFGDLVLAPRIVGLATAIAYAIAQSDDPVRAALPLIRGYHLQWPLHPDELAILWPLVRMRLVMSVINAVEQYAADPGNDYLLVSQDVVPRMLLSLDAMSDYLALCRAREACGYDASPRARAVRQHLRATPQGWRALPATWMCSPVTMPRIAMSTAARRSRARSARSTWASISSSLRAARSSHRTTGSWRPWRPGPMPATTATSSSCATPPMTGFPSGPSSAT